MFEEAYGSVLHHPLAMWGGGAVVLVLLVARSMWRRQFLGVALIVFQLAIMLDAWLTGGLSPLSAGTGWATAAGVTFVILGDLRYFVLLERYGRAEPMSLIRWLTPLGCALVVPVASNVARFVWPGNFRALFLTYELMFLALALTLRGWLLPRRQNDAPEPTFVRRLTHFEIAQYGLWAAADIVILAGADVGYLLRFVPNLLYYVAFVPFVWAIAPKRLTA